jgi:hypothetical protein
MAGVVGTMDELQFQCFKDTYGFDPPTFLMDPRLREVGHGYDDPWNKLVSRRDIDPEIRDLFTWPEEFYPHQSDNKEEDPDTQQDWYQGKSLWKGDYYHTVQMLERAASFKEFLYNGPEKQIIVITSNCFLEALLKDDEPDFRTMEHRECVWKTTVSGKKTLKRSSNTIPEPIQDDDYSKYWMVSPWKSEERSQYFCKWYSKPYNGMLHVLRETDECGDCADCKIDWCFRHDSRLFEFVKDETVEKLLQEAGDNFVEAEKPKRMGYGYGMLW